MRCDVTNPFFHRFKLGRKNLWAAVSQIDRPWTDGCSVSPCRASRLFLQQIGNYVADVAILPLIRRQIRQPFGKEFLHIIIQAGSADKYLRIPGPPQALVSLRAVGRHIEEIALLPPDDIVKKAVEQRIGAA